MITCTDGTDDSTLCYWSVQFGNGPPAVPSFHHFHDVGPPIGKRLADRLLSMRRLSEHPADYSVDLGIETSTMAEQNTLRMPRVDLSDGRLRPSPLDEQRQPHAEKNLAIGIVHPCELSAPSTERGTYPDYRQCGSPPSVAIVVIGAWIPAVPWGEALVGISVIAIPWGDISAVARIPTRTVAPAISPPLPTISIVVITMIPTVGPPGPMIIPMVAIPTMPVTMAMPMAR